MPDLQLLPELYATPHRFLWCSPLRAAVVADLHLGHVGGVGGMEHVEGAWAVVCQRMPARVVVAGDLFDSPEPEGWAVELCRGMFGKLPEDCEIWVTPGNHDPLDLGKVFGGRVRVERTMTLGSCIVSHGHELPEELLGARGKTWVVGHQHPAVRFTTKVQTAKMACYAVCEASAGWSGRGEVRPRMMVLPAFSRDGGGPLGSNLLGVGNWLLPVPRPGNEKVRVFGLIEPAAGEAQVLDFGLLSGLPQTA